MTRSGPAALLAAVLAAAGCVSYKSGLDLPDPAALLPGVTTRAEVYERFGLPDGIRRRGDAVVLTWEVGAGRGYAVGAGWRSVGFSTMETRFTKSTLEVRLDPSDRVAGACWTDGEGRCCRLGE